MKPICAVRHLPDAQHRKQAGGKKEGVFHVSETSGSQAWGVAACPDEVLDLLPGNQHLADGLAACQPATPEQATNGFCAQIQCASRLMDVIKQGLDLSRFFRPDGRQLRVFGVVCHSRFCCFFHGRDWPCSFFSNLVFGRIREVFGTFREVFGMFRKGKESQ